MNQQAFLDALMSQKRSAELDPVDDLFGFLIGSWDLDAILHDADGHTRTSRGELHAAWVLEGRAIQDLFIFPHRHDRARAAPAQGDRYATTIRTYDRKLQAWRVNFINPAADETSASLLAHRNGHGIAMDGKLADGTPVRWYYREITPATFYYGAEQFRDDERSPWRLYLELFGKRA